MLSVFESPVFFLVDPAMIEEAFEDVLVSVSGSSCMEAAIVDMKARSHSVVFQFQDDVVQVGPASLPI